MSLQSPETYYKKNHTHMHTPPKHPTKCHLRKGKWKGELYISDTTLLL